MRTIAVAGKIRAGWMDIETLQAQLDELTECLQRIEAVRDELRERGHSEIHITDGVGSLHVAAARAAAFAKNIERALAAGRVRAKRMRSAGRRRLPREGE